MLFALFFVNPIPQQSKKAFPWRLVFPMIIVKWIQEVLERLKLSNDSEKPIAEIAQQNLKAFDFDLHLPVFVPGGEKDDILKIPHLVLYVFKFRNADPLAWLELLAKCGNESVLENVEARTQLTFDLLKSYTTITVCLLDSLNLNCLHWSKNLLHTDAIKTLFPQHSPNNFIGKHLNFEIIQCPLQTETTSCGYQLPWNSVLYAISDQPPQHPADTQTVYQHSMEILGPRQTPALHTPTPSGKVDLPPQKHKPFQNYFLSFALLATVLAAIIVLILYSTLPAASFSVLGGSWGLLAATVGAVLLVTAIIWLVFWTIYQCKQAPVLHQPAFPTILASPGNPTILPKPGSSLHPIAPRPSSPTPEIPISLSFAAPAS